MSAHEATPEFGPVEIVLVRTENESPDAQLWELLFEQIDATSVALLDVAVVRKDDAGDVTIHEIENIGADAALDSLAHGLTTEDDLLELAEQLEPGENAVVVAFEHVWARNLASRLAAVGGAVVDAVRIPAPIVNQSIAEASLAERNN